MSRVRVLSAKKAENPNRATSRRWPIAQARDSHTATATPAETSLTVSRLAIWCPWAAVSPGALARAACTRPAVAAMVTTAAASTSAPRHISLTAPRTPRRPAADRAGGPANPAPPLAFPRRGEQDPEDLLPALLPERLRIAHQ